MGKNQMFSFYGEVKAETRKAYLISDGENEFWIPKSQIKKIDFLKNDDVEVDIPEWLALEKGII